MMAFVQAVVALVFATLMAEVLSRKYWQKIASIRFRDPARIYQAFYPELEQVEKKRPVRGDGFFNILMLGGSSLTGGWSAVEKCLAEQLFLFGARNIRIFNLSVDGHTSLDSLHKYAALEGFSFDLVIYYPGGAEVKVNNVPPELFREDYGHFADNELKNYLITHHGKARFSLVYGLRAYLLRLRRKRQDDNYVPLRRPRPNWTGYGAEIRSSGPFRRNLEDFMDLARRRGEPIIAMTYAFHTARNYSLENFEKKALDYVLHLLPYEKFGIRENVVATFLAHNQILRALCTDDANVTLVDQELMMSGLRDGFNDPFHFTVAGAMRFAENLIPFILPLLANEDQDKIARRLETAVL